MTEVLTSDNYSERVLLGLRRLQEGDSLCDLTLIADNAPIRVHRPVMAASSDYFEALLTLDMQERTQKVITLKGVPSKGLQEIVKFVYTGQLRCSLDNITDVLLAASHLQMTEAVGLCSRYLISLTNMGNSVDMYNIA